MESSVHDLKGSNEDLTGKKKTRFQALKSRLFGRMKRKENEGEMKQSQSISDIIAPADVRGGNDSEDEIVYSQGILGSRALSHDSIFLLEQSQGAAEPGLVLEQGSKHSKIRALQMKLQQQNIRLGPPPLMGIPSRRTEDTGASCEDDGLLHTPPKTFQQATLERGLAHKGSPQSTSPPPQAVTVPSPGVDFDTPVNFTPSLDTSAARHRLSIKPRNQRASTKGRKLPSAAPRPRAESLNDLENSLMEREEENEQDGSVRTRSYSSHVLLKELEEPPAPEVQKPPSASNPKSLERNNAEPPSETESVPQQEEPKPRTPPNALLHAPFIDERPPTQKQSSSPEAAALAAPAAAAEPQKTQESVQEAVPVTPPSASQSQHSKDLVREMLNESRRRTSPRDASRSAKPAPVLEVTSSQEPSLKLRPADLSAAKFSNGRGDVSVIAEALAKAQQHPTKRPHATAGTTKTNMAKTILSTDKEPEIQKLTATKQNTAGMIEAAEQGGSTSEPTLKSTPSAGQEDKLPVDTAVPQKQRLISGSFRFSVSAARDRLRTCNLTGKGEKARAKTEETLAKKVKGQSTAKSEEARGKVQPLNPLSVTKVPEDNVVRTSSRPSLQEQLAPVLQEAKGKEPPQDHPSGPERKTPVRKEDVSTGDEGDGCGNSGQATDGEVDRGAETKRNEIEDVQRGREVVPERNAFGVKLRTTSLSLRYRSDLAQSEPKSKVVVRSCSPPCDPRSSPLPPLATKSSVPEEKQDTSPGSDALRDTPVGTPLDDSTGTSQPSISLLKESPSQKSDTPTPSASTLSQPSPTPTEGAGTIKNRDNGHPTNQEPAPPKEAEPQVSEPSWMTLARERSRSLQQLLTGRLPGVITMARPAPKTTPPQATQTTTLPTPQTTPQTSQQSAQQSPQKPEQISTQQSAQQAPHQPEQINTQQTAPKTVPLPGPHNSPQPTPQISQQPESYSTPQTPLTLQGRSQRTLTMENKDKVPDMESKTELKKASPEIHAKVEHAASNRNTSNYKTDIKLEEKTANKIHTPDDAVNDSTVQRRNKDDWRQKRTEPISSPSLMSGGQPSWMELAKRKSLAWSDKTMD